jgi:hypothetical protein
VLLLWGTDYCSETFLFCNFFLNVCISIATLQVVVKAEYNWYPLILINTSYKKTRRENNAWIALEKVDFFFCDFEDIPFLYVDRTDREYRSRSATTLGPREERRAGLILWQLFLLSPIYPAQASKIHSAWPTLWYSFRSFFLVHSQCCPKKNSTHVSRPSEHSHALQDLFDYS